jgi:hypothetical protein
VLSFDLSGKGGPTSSYTSAGNASFTDNKLCLLTVFMLHTVATVKVKVKVKVTFTLEQAMKTQRGSIRVALFFFNLGARCGWGGWSTPRTDRCTPGRDTVPIVQEAVWGPGPV